MASSITVGGLHHVTLTVTDLRRSLDFYTGVLGFQEVLPLSETRTILSNNQLLLVLTMPPDPSQAPANDRFNENRAGLDHISFNANSRADLDTAVQVFDENGVSHGDIRDLGEGLRIYVLAFRDPDNIQLELTAPYS